MKEEYEFYAVSNHKVCGRVLAKLIDAGSEKIRLSMTRDEFESWREHLHAIGIELCGVFRHTFSEKQYVPPYDPKFEEKRVGAKS